MTISGAGTPVGDVVGGAGATVDLYWLPLDAGGHFVRLNGRAFEAAAARAARRPAWDLYHSALEVRVAAARFVIEQAPVRDARPGGVVGRKARVVLPAQDKARASDRSLMSIWGHDPIQSVSQTPIH